MNVWVEKVVRQVFPFFHPSAIMAQQAEELTDTVVKDEVVIKKEIPRGFHAIHTVSKSATGFTPFASRILKKAKNRLLRQENEDENTEGTSYVSPANLFKSMGEGEPSLHGFDPTLQQSKNTTNSFISASKKLPKVR